MTKKMNIAIIGFGRFGQLCADLLKIYGTVHIVSRNKIHNTRFKQIDHKELGNMDLIIPAVPISSLESVLKKIKTVLKPGALVMDVCSVKVEPCKWMKKILPKHIDILGTHPMFGPDSAKYGLKGLSMVFCPVRIKHSRLKEIMSIFKKMQLDTVVMTPNAHDKEAAVSLALVHYIGRGLSMFKIKPQQVSTLGFERLLTVNETVENDTWQLFKDMHKYNPYSKALRKKFVDSLKVLEKKIS